LDLQSSYKSEKVEYQCNDIDATAIMFLTRHPLLSTSYAGMPKKKKASLAEPIEVG